MNLKLHIQEILEVSKYKKDKAVSKHNDKGSTDQGKSSEEIKLINSVILFFYLFLNSGFEVYTETN